MSMARISLLSVQSINKEKIELIFSRTKEFKEEFFKTGRLGHLHRQRFSYPVVIALVFFEPSTRTRLSFQAAAYRLGFSPLVLDNPISSSLQKGESQIDTLKNISAMSPNLMVVRYGESKEITEFLSTLPFPVINAGGGVDEHPSQALLDAYTVMEKLGSLSGCRVLFVGDIIHSRVARSDIKLFRQLGAEIALCGPNELLPREEEKDWSDVRRFNELSSAISWCQVLVGLRVQTERHRQNNFNLDLSDYKAKFRVEGKHLALLSSEGIIMHPGPVICGIEFSSEVLKDPRCVILQQVTNGLFVRAALYSLILEREV